VEDTILSFSELGLNSDCLATLEQAGYKEPTELQQQLIPLIKANKSVLVKRLSASGKTGAFLIPAINYVLDNPLEDYHGARIMILTSRKDRVNQIKYTVKKLANSQNFRFGFIVSGRPYQPQMRLLRRPLDIMVATPGRLSDLSNNGKANFSQLEMLIVDDLASTYHKGFQSLVDKIISQRSGNYPVIFFVRDDHEVVHYAKSLVPEVIELDVEEEKHPLAKIPQILHLCDDYTHKIAIMDYLLDDYQGESTLIYTANEKSAIHLVDNLANHGHAADLASTLSTQEQADSEILVVSDEQHLTLAAYDFKHVVQFEVAKSTQYYSDRLANKQWESRDNAIVALLSIQERESLKKIEEFIAMQLEQRNVPSLEPLNSFATFKPDFLNPTNKKEKKSGQRRNSGQFGKRRASADRHKKDRSPSEAQEKGQQQPRRAKKGRFGRLSGGIHRKREEGNNTTSNSKAHWKKKPQGDTDTHRTHQTTQTFSQAKSKSYTNANKPSYSKPAKTQYNKPRGHWNSSTNSEPAFPVIKDPQELAAQKASTKKVVVRYKDKKRFLKK
jgi:superfamily II DNA/RNA helicase